MPSQAKAGFTVVFYPDFYNKHKGERIHLDILDDNGNILESHEPYILDQHGIKEEYGGKTIIDFYIGERKKCRCNKHPWSGKECRFKFI